MWDIIKDITGKLGEDQFKYDDLLKNPTLKSMNEYDLKQKLSEFCQNGKIYEMGNNDTYMLIWWETSSCEFMKIWKFLWD